MSLEKNFNTRIVIFNSRQVPMFFWQIACAPLWSVNWRSFSDIICWGPDRSVTLSFFCWSSNSPTCSQKIFNFSGGTGKCLTLWPNVSACCSKEVTVLITPSSFSLTCRATDHIPTQVPQSFFQIPSRCPKASFRFQTGPKLLSDSKQVPQSFFQIPNRCPKASFRIQTGAPKLLLDSKQVPQSFFQNPNRCPKASFWKLVSDSKLQMLGWGFCQTWAFELSGHAMHPMFPISMIHMCVWSSLTCVGNSPLSILVFSLSVIWNFQPTESNRWLRSV